MVDTLVQTNSPAETTGLARSADARPPVQRLSLAQMMVEAGVLTHAQVRESQENARRGKIPLGQLLVRDGLILPRDLAELTALNLGLTMVDLRSQSIDPEAVAILNPGCGSPQCCYCPYEPGPG